MYHYIIKGNRGKTIIFIHGFMENISFWDNYVEEFSKNHTVITFDILGHGKNQTSNKFHLNDITQQLLDILEKEKIEKCFLIGHSMGGYVALDFLRKYEKKVTGIALVNSTFLKECKEKIKQRKKFIEIVGKGLKKRVINNVITNLFFIKNQEQINKVKNMAMQCEDNNIFYSTNSIIERKNNSKIFITSNCKKLILWGEKDTILKFQPMEKYLNDSIKVIKLNTGHMSPLEDFKGTFSALKNFIQ